MPHQRTTGSIHHDCDLLCWLQNAEPDRSSTSSEEGSNTDSGCVLSESLPPDAHEQQPQVPQRTYPTTRPRDVNKQTLPIMHPQHLQQQSPRKHSLHKDLVKQRLKASKRSDSKPKSAVKLRYVDTHNNDWHTGPHGGNSIDVDRCAVAMTHDIMGRQHSLVEPFSDSSSVFRYKIPHPSSQTGTSEFTEDTSSSTSGSYILTEEQQATVC